MGVREDRGLDCRIGGQRLKNGGRCLFHRDSVDLLFNVLLHTSVRQQGCSGEMNRFYGNL